MTYSEQMIDTFEYEDNDFEDEFDDELDDLEEND